MAVYKGINKINGGIYQLHTHAHRGGEDVMYYIISPLNHCRYTNEQIYQEVQEQLAENPFLKPLVESLLPELKKKAKKNPDANFCFSHWGKTKEIAQKELKELQWSKLDALTRVLFYQYYKQEIAAGEITVSAFFQYTRATIFQNDTGDPKRLQGAVTNHLLPVIGSKKLCTLAQMSLQEQGKLCESIRMHLVQEDLGEQTYHDVRKGLQLLLEAAQSYHLKFNYTPASLSSRIRMFNQQNRQMQQSFVPQHMDNAQRNRFFSVLQSLPDDGFALYIAGLVYSGLDYSDIPAIRFHMLQRIDLPQEHFYSILVDGRMYKNEKKFARRGILNEDCAFSVFRTMVLAPWAVTLLDRQIERFHAYGLTDTQIGKLPLSCQVHNKVSLNPSELEECLIEALQQTEIPAVKLPRAKKNQPPQEMLIEPNAKLIRNDALYVAEQWYLASLPMVHAMFGKPMTETDETSYLDLDNVELCRQWYQHMRRFDPIFSASPQMDETQNTFFLGTQPHALHVIVHAEENTQICIHTDYAANVTWKEI